MNIVKKTLSAALVLSCSLLAVSAQAQENEEPTTKPRAVLFKVHDIKPVENQDGVVTHCDFLVTFYNRSTESLRQAKLDMSWRDEVSDRYVISDDDIKAAPVVPVNQRNTRGGQLVMSDIATSVDMPALGSYKQATVKGSVKTEKCFLLLDNLDFNVAACSVIGKEDNTTQAPSNRRGRVAATRNTSECANMFQYVDSKNPEYYDEFKNISFSEQERLLKDEKKQDTSDIESTYENTVKNFDRANSILSNIK